ncbi:anti-sigma factor RsiW [Rhizobium sp. BK313]|uniref:anti-sigma factor family protein n=1 Tax=Rhizobium sp. BK313 TaxID=2587081 RepID=UPI00105D4558|nr:anti-sigma factor [Rhizobium sp. BK313]MBB3456114.1 anti-sigma factor RsiW [Rhizobium sp. BK313]
MTMQPITEDDLHAYVDDALDAERRAEIVAYLESHADVAARVEGYHLQRRKLRDVFDPIADEPVPTALNLAHMIEGRRNRAVIAPWWMAAAATALFVFGGGSGWWLHGLSLPANEGVVALAREAVDNYGAYASDKVRPVELRADDSAKLVAWASERLQHPVSLPDLSASGYRLMGGRVTATTHGPGLMLMYDNDHGTRLVLLTRPMLVDQNKPMDEHSEGTTTGFTWASNGMGYSLVGPSTSEDLHPLANDIRHQVETKV